MKFAGKLNVIKIFFIHRHWDSHRFVCKLYEIASKQFQKKKKLRINPDADLTRTEMGKF